MTHALPDPIAPGAAHQLTSLAMAMAGAALVVLLLVVVLWAWRRWRGAATDQEAPPPGESWLRTGFSAAPIRRLLGIILLLALVLPATVAVRQLWPHPALGRRLIVVWLLVLLVPSLTWLAARAGNRFRRPGS